MRDDDTAIYQNLLLVTGYRFPSKASTFGRFEMARYYLYLLLLGSCELVECLSLMGECLSVKVVEVF